MGTGLHNINFRRVQDCGRTPSDFMCSVDGCQKVTKMSLQVEQMIEDANYELAVSTGIVRPSIMRCRFNTGRRDVAFHWNGYSESTELENGLRSSAEGARSKSKANDECTKLCV